MNLTQLADKINQIYGAEVFYEDPYMGSKEHWLRGFLDGSKDVDEGVGASLVKEIVGENSNHYILNIGTNLFEVEQIGDSFKMFEVAPIEVVEYVRTGEVK